MKQFYLFVWSDVANCSNSYHSGGGVVVIASDQKRAIELAAMEGAFIADDELPEVYIVESVVEKVYIFPDAGCC